MHLESNLMKVFPLLILIAFLTIRSTLSFADPFYLNLESDFMEFLEQKIALLTNEEKHHTLSYVASHIERTLTFWGKDYGKYLLNKYPLSFVSNKDETYNFTKQDIDNLLSEVNRTLYTYANHGTSECHITDEEIMYYLYIFQVEKIPFSNFYMINIFDTLNHLLKKLKFKGDTNPALDKLEKIFKQYKDDIGKGISSIFTTNQKPKSQKTKKSTCNLL